MAYRTKVLGRALLAVRTDVNSFWMLLSENAEVAFPSRTTAAVAEVADLSTLANVGAPANANAAPIVASTGFATAASSDVAVPAAGQKRKACP
jgi:hypothetical protein